MNVEIKTNDVVVVELSQDEVQELANLACAIKANYNREINAVLKGKARKVFTTDNCADIFTDTYFFLQKIIGNTPKQSCPRTSVFAPCSPITNWCDHQEPPRGR